MFAAAGEQSRTGHLDLAVVLDAHRYQRAPRPRRGCRGAPALILQPHLAGGPARPTPPLKTTSGTRQTPSWDAHHLADTREGPQGADAVHVLGQRDGPFAGAIRARPRPEQLRSGLHLERWQCYLLEVRFLLISLLPCLQRKASFFFYWLFGLLGDWRWLKLWYHRMFFFLIKRF